MNIATENTQQERITTMAAMAAVIQTDPIQAMHNLSIRMPLDPVKYQDDELSINLATMLLCIPEHPPRRANGTIVLMSGITYRLSGSSVYVS